MTEATQIAQKLGKIESDLEWVQQEITRLTQKNTVALEHLKDLHEWLDGKRKLRRSCRILGESRTGKTVACEAYVKKTQQSKKPQERQTKNKIPIKSVIMIMPPQKCGSKEFFLEIIESLEFRADKGTIAQFRSRAIDALKECQVEMLIIDEADRLKPETFAEVRDISDKLEISVVLVGTDRLDAVVKRDEQVYNRFRANRRFGKLAGEEFKKTVAIWEQKVLKLPVASNLTNSKILKILLAATEGYIGRLDELLRDTAIASVSRGFKKVEESVLKEIAKEYS